MSSRHAQRAPLPVARHARLLLLLLPRPPLAPRAPMRSRIAMPDPLDRKGIQATLHQIIQALAAGHISARRAGVLLYGIQMSLSQAPQAPVPTIPVLKP
jgi:hypothetical protein